VRRYLSGMKAYSTLCGVAMVCVVTGCSTTGTKVDQTQVDTIRVGDGKADVQARIGAPDQISRGMAGNETWIYSYSRSRPNAKRFIPLLGTFIGGKNVETQTVTVMFDEVGRVADVATAYGGTKGETATGRPAESATGTVEAREEVYR